jgi:hypothetical protein
MEVTCDKDMALFFLVIETDQLQYIDEYDY